MKTKIVCNLLNYTFGMENNFKVYRRKRGISVKDMASRLAVSRNTYTNYEKGSYEPNFNTLIKISKILNTSIDVLLNNTDFMSKQKGTDELIAAIENVIKEFK